MEPPNPAEEIQQLTLWMMFIWHSNPGWFLMQELLELELTEEEAEAEIFTSRICSRGSVFVVSVCLFVFLGYTV